MVPYQMCWHSHTSQHCMMTNGVALPVYMYLSVWRPFHHTKLHAYTLSSLIKCNVGGGGGGGGYPWPHYGSVTPSLTIWLCYPWLQYDFVTPGASLWLCYPWPYYGSVLPQASLWLCYPRPHYGSATPAWPHYGSLTPAWPHYGSVTPGLTTLPVCVTEILIYCLIEPFPTFLVYN